MRAQLAHFLSTFCPLNHDEARLSSRHSKIFGGVTISNGRKVSIVLSRFVVSFVNEFGMQEDHLHSASTVYYPVSKTYFAPLMLFLSPSLLFFTALAVYLLNLYTEKLFRH